MPKKITNEDNIIKLYRELLKTIQVPDENFLSSLQGDDLRDFQKHCYETVQNKFFKQIFDRFVYIQCMCTADNAVSPEQIMNGKLMVNGFETVREFYKDQASRYQIEHLTPKGEFDPNKSFEPAKI